MPLANYFPYPGIQPFPKTPEGMGDWAAANVHVTTWKFAKIAITLGAGYYIGKFFKHPIAGALLSGAFGLPGIFVLALMADKPATAIANRRRRGKRARRCMRRRGSRR